MKIKYYFPLVLLLTGCSLFKGHAYDFAYKAIDELSKHSDCQFQIWSINLAYKCINFSIFIY